MRRNIRKYIMELSATIVVAFALMAPIVIGSAGMALDFAYAYLVQQRLAQAIDSAALAAAASSTDPDVIRQRVLDFFEANYPPGKLGATFDPDVEVVGNEIRVTGKADYDTFFLAVIGIKNLQVSAATVVQREVQGLEVVLVLDNTGSMAEHNNIQTLKDATKDFIDVLFDNTDDPDTIKIGLVPYSNSVRVGSYGLGKNPDGTTYGDGTEFVTLPAGISTTTNRSSSSGWYGCVIEHKASGYSSTATHVAGSAGQLWHTGSGSNCNSSTNCKGHGWAPNLTTNDPYDYDVLDRYEGPWDIYMYGKIIANGSKCSDLSSNSMNYSNSTPSRCSDCSGSGGKCNSTYCYCMLGTSGNSDDGPNTGCPYAQILPLTSDRDDLIDRVDDMEPDGNTLGNIGMAWGYRLLSPEAPFTESHPWDNEYWRKVIIMMTDGDNTENADYSSYWFTAKNAMTVSKFNTRFAETCAAMKAKGVMIYTVTFTSGINQTTKNYYKNCASSPDQYYDAPTQQELLDVFDKISRELSNLHIRS